MILIILKFIIIIFQNHVLKWPVVAKLWFLCYTCRHVLVGAKKRKLTRSSQNQKLIDGFLLRRHSPWNGEPSPWHIRRRTCKSASLIHSLLLLLFAFLDNNVAVKLEKKILEIWIHISLKTRSDLTVLNYLSYRYEITLNNAILAEDKHKST